MQVFQQCEFGLGSGFPTESERCQKFIEPPSVEDHALQDAVHELVECLDGNVMTFGDVGQLGGVFFPFESCISLTNGGFTQSFTDFQGGDLGGNVLALVHEFGVALDESDELFAGHFLLAGLLLRVPANQPHDVVVIDQR